MREPNGEAGVLADGPDASEAKAGGGEGSFAVAPKGSDYSAKGSRVGLSRSLLARSRRSVARGSTGLTVLALLTGAGAGVGAIAFRYMILGVTYAFTGHRDFSAAGHASNPFVPSLGIWFVVLVPVLGGLLYGPLVARFAPEARGHGVPEVMYASTGSVAACARRCRSSSRWPRRCASAPAGRSGARGRSCRSARRSDR